MDDVSDEYLFKRRLTDNEMTGIEAAIGIADSAAAALEAALIEFYDVAVRATHARHYSEVGAINPRDFAIPEDQWTAIAALLISSGDGLIGAWAGMEWMTYGPSIYKAE